MSNPTIACINPAALAPPPGYAHIVLVQAGRLAFIAGQVATDRHGALVGAGDIAAQAEQVFRNLDAALAAIGGTPRERVKLTVFLRDMRHLPLYRRARDRFLAGATPAITLVEVSSLFAPEYLIEVEAVAAIA